MLIIKENKLNMLKTYNEYGEDGTYTYEEIAKTLKSYKGYVFCYDLSKIFHILRNYTEFEKVMARQKHDVISATLKGTKCTLRSVEALMMYEPEIEETIYGIKEITKRFKKVPMTFTSILRQDYKNYLKKNYKEDGYGYHDWCEKYSKITPNTYTFEDLVKCFWGGYLCSNYSHTGKIIKDVHSFDFNSSYIYSALAEKYPISKFEICLDDNYDFDKFAYIFEVELYNYSSDGYVDFIPSWKVNFTKSRYMNIEDGRMVSAEVLRLTCTDVDLQNILDSCKCSSYTIISAKRAYKDYLPKVLRAFIMEEYSKKYKVKKECGGSSIQYKTQKRRVNCIYGMCVTNYIRDICEFNDGEWEERPLTELDIEQELINMKKKQKVVLPYQWGVWISAYSRRNIWENIIKIGYDLVYSDTDSVKFIGDHKDIIDAYNKKATAKLKKAFEDNGEKFTNTFSLLGTFEEEETAKEFKTLGVKRYVCKYDDGRLEITVAGLNKTKSVEALKGDINNFKYGFKFNEDYSGKKNRLYAKDSDGKYNVYDTPIEYQLKKFDDMAVSNNGCSILKRL